jgi:hypothetical protein
MSLVGGKVPWNPVLLDIGYGANGCDDFQCRLLATVPALSDYLELNSWGSTSSKCQQRIKARKS